MSINRACHLLNLSRSVYQYESKREDDPQVKAVLKQKVNEYPTEGFWSIYDRLRAEGYAWNHKKVYKVYTALGLTIQKKSKNTPLRLRELQQLPHELNDTWLLDLDKGTIWEVGTYYSFYVMDQCSRELLHVEIDDSLKQQAVMAGLEQLIKQREKPKQIEVASAMQGDSLGLKAWGQANGVIISYTKHEPLRYIERPHQLFKTNVLDRYIFHSLESVCSVTAEWVKEYNTTAQQDILNGLSPIKYAQTKAKES